MDTIHRYNPLISSIDLIHGYDPWEPMGGTMGSRGGYHGCPMGRIPKPPGPQGTLGPLGPQGLIGPQGLMAPQGTQGSGSMAWMRRSKWLRTANSTPSRAAREGMATRARVFSGVKKKNLFLHLRRKNRSFGRSVARSLGRSVVV